MPVYAAITALVLMIGLAVWALGRGADRIALASLVAAPLLAGGLYLWAASASSTHAQTGASSTSVTPLPTTTEAGSRVDNVRAQAETARQAKDFPTAVARYREITQMAPMDPDGWADLGDAEAAAAGSNLAAGRASIDRALELNAKHPKALWLKASLDLQDKHYADAAAVWQRLLTVLPADSSDADIIRTNLEEAKKLAAEGSTP